MVLAQIAVRFIVELLGVGFVGYWGFTASNDTIVRLLLAVGGVSVFAAGWGLLLAPDARRGLGGFRKDMVGTAVLLMSAALLTLAGQALPAVVYAGVVIANAGLLLILRDDVSRSLARIGPRG